MQVIKALGEHFTSVKKYIEKKLWVRKYLASHLSPRCDTVRAYNLLALRQSCSPQFEWCHL